MKLSKILEVISKVTIWFKQSQHNFLQTFVKDIKADIYEIFEIIKIMKILFQKWVILLIPSDILKILLQLQRKFVIDFEKFVELFEA